MTRQRERGERARERENEREGEKLERLTSLRPPTDAVEPSTAKMNKERDI